MTRRFNVVHPRDGSYVHQTVFLYYILREANTVGCTAYAARDLPGNSSHSLEPFSLRSLLYRYQYIVSLTIYSSLSVNPYGLLRNNLTEPATGYRKILSLIQNQSRVFTIQDIAICQTAKLRLSKNYSAN